MGRLTTDVAAVIANADNLPPKDSLPNISIWDAFLPKRQTPVPKEQPLDPTVGMRVYREFYNVKKDKDGKKMIMVHRNGEGSKKGEVMTEDVKKDGNGKAANGSKAGGGEAAKNGGNGGGEEKKNGSAEQKAADAPWTAEEDEKLRAMKADSRPWKEIVAEIGRGQHDCKNRAKELGIVHGQPQKKEEAAAENGGAAGDKKNGKKDDAKPEKKDKKADKKADIPSNGDKKSIPTASSKAPSKAASQAGSGQARFTMGEWMTLQEDDLFSFGELQCLSELIMRDENQRWLRIASLFADKTGRKVHADDIREKFVEIGRMG